MPLRSGIVFALLIVLAGLGGCIDDGDDERKPTTDDDGAQTVTCYRDLDGDACGDPADSQDVQGTECPSGWVENGDDCNDDPLADGGSMYPGNGEVCDGLDNDCSGEADDGGAALCDDGFYCNGAETCAGAGGCRAGSDPCPDDGTFCNGEESCDEEADSCDHSGDPCGDDGAYCNGTESCNEGTDTCDHSGDPCGDDGAYCNGDESCNEGTDSCDHSGDPCGDDGVYCNGDESCNEGTDTCDHSGDPCGDDGAYCNGDESCNEGTDTCDHSGDPCGDDGTYCNGTESCNEGTDTCDHSGDPCGDDGTYCNGEESCNEGTDTCDHSGDPCGDDGAYCNGDESCNEGTDTCDHSGDPCGDDGAYCNGDESCNEGTDSCDHSGDPCGDDGVYCNGTESCNEGTDTCDHSGDPCGDDGVFCNGAEVCIEDGDSCDHSGDPCGDDGAYCNGDESCNEDTDTCDHSGDPCGDDGTYCNGTESCNEGTDTCDHSGDPCGDDGTYCNGTESCNEGADSCDHTGDPCSDDGLWCTGVEYCDETEDSCAATGDPCQGESICCEGADRCEVDSCDCVDSDFDGYFAYDPDYCPEGDDCDDQDVLVHPGAVELPDDGIDQDCAGGDVSRSDEIGIFVATTGSDDNPGTMGEPVRTMGVAVDLALAEDKSVFVAAGTYEELVSSQVSLYGGYDASGWTRDIDENETILLDDDDRFGITVTAPDQRGIAVQGLRIEGTPYLYSDNTYHSTGLTVLGPGPVTVVDNWIVGARVGTPLADEIIATGLILDAPTTVARCHIDGGIPSSAGSADVRGVNVVEYPVVLVDNIISAGGPETGVEISDYFAMGVISFSDLVLYRNSVDGGTPIAGGTDGYARAIGVYTLGNSIIVDNVISAGVATGVQRASAIGVYATDPYYIAERMTRVEGNRIDGGTVIVGSTTHLGRGLDFDSSTSQSYAASIRGNEVFGDAPLIIYHHAPEATFQVAGNLFCWGLSTQNQSINVYVGTQWGDGGPADSLRVTFVQNTIKGPFPQAGDWLRHRRRIQPVLR